MIDLLNVYSKVEGDFQWGLAYHSYAQDLTNPCTWNDPNATCSMNTQFVTFKNLEVLNKWAFGIKKINIKELLNVLYGFRKQG